MKGYSVLGYLNAVMRRSAKTLLVEGKTDQLLLMRLKRNRASILGYESAGNIDTVKLIEDPILVGLGHKERINTILAQLTMNGTARTKLEKKLGSLRDREWDGVDIVDMQLQSPWKAPSQEQGHFTTMGHSVENYFFNVETIEAYLNHFFFQHLQVDFFNDLSSRFHAVIALSASYSLAIRNLCALTRCDDVITRKHVKWENERYSFCPELNISLSSRGINVPTEFHALINRNIEVYLTKHQEIEPGRWLCHGHLGEQAIWACIANLAEQHNVGMEIAQNIERGSQENRFTHFANHLCQQHSNSSMPLHMALDWLSTCSEPPED